MRAVKTSLPVVQAASDVACCTPLSAQPLPRPMAKRLAASFQALAEPARLRLLSLIQAQPGGEACVCNLVAPLGLSQPTVTHHLQVLHRAGLLAREKRGVWVYYRVVDEALVALRRALS
jgi:ArsR family transcriptional regulator, arsenate/arsenite/antimonite-responsive transcriptional repressor